MEFLLHKKFGRAIFFSYREFSLTRSSLIGSFDCTINFSNDVGFLPKINWKKSDMVKIEESEKKSGIYLFKMETFVKKASSKYVSSTFQVHVL